MNENKRKQEIGIVNFQEYDVFRWKIPNVSSLDHTVDFEVQSPSFIFEDASWILKIYPYGQTEYESSGYIDVVIQMLDPQAHECTMFCQISCEDVFGMEVNHIKRQFVFDKQFMQARAIRFMQNLQDYPEKWKIAPNDTLTLVCAIEKSNNIHKKLVQTESSAGKESTTNRSTTNPEIGELLIVGEIGNYYAKMQWNLHELPSSIYSIHTKPFPFASASWVIYPCFPVEQSNEQTFSMVLERRETEIPEHNISFKLEKKFYTDDEVSLEKDQERSFVFNSYCTQGLVMHCPLQELGINTNENYASIYFNFEMKMKKNSESDLKSSTTMAESNLGNENISRSSTVVLNKALEDFKAFYLRKEDCDVTIKVNGQEFAAHKAILQARSPVLASAFRCNMKEKATGVIDIKDCDPIYFSDFLCYLYCGEVQNISVENVHSLFVIADKYDVSDLKSNCLEFMKKNVNLDTFCDVIALALQYSENELIKLATDFFVKNMESIIVSSKWQSFILENPIQGNELVIKAVTSKKK